MSLHRLPLSLLLGLCLTGGVHAAALRDHVPGHRDLTYFDLMKHVVTDLAPHGTGGATGSDIVPFTHIEGKHATAAPADDPVDFDHVDVMAIPGDPEHLILRTDLGPSDGNVEEAELLSLFVLAPRVRLLDVVEVGNDRFTGFSEGNPQLLAPRTPLILIESSHSNSDQSYQTTEMIFIRGGRFRLIDTVATFGERSCAAERTQTPSVTTMADNRPYRAIHLVVRSQVKPTGEDCGDETMPRARNARYQATYRWDARRQKFVTRSDALNRLAIQNENRF
jgi:hypothetical protein